MFGVDDALIIAALASAAATAYSASQSGKPRGMAPEPTGMQKQPVQTPNIFGGQNSLLGQTSKPRLSEMLGGADYTPQFGPQGNSQFDKLMAMRRLHGLLG